MSLGNVLGAAAPIAAGYFTGGLSSGFAGLSAGTMSGIAGGALAGAGIAALSGDDVLMGAASGGLGGYGGAGMAGANTAAKAAAQQTLGAGTLNAQQAAMAGYTGPTSMMQSAGLGGASGTGAGIGGLPMGTNNQIGSSLMGAKVPPMPSGPLGSGAMPQANLDLSKAGGYQYNANEIAGKGIGRTQDFSGGMMGDLKSTAIPEAQFGKDYGFSDIARELGDGDTTTGYMKAGLTALPVATAALTPEYEGGSYNDNPMNKYDPTRRLDLSMETGIDEALTKDTGLRLLAEGGYLDGGNVGDGMSDDIPATINGNQPAALADGEFVVPADVVSHLGNGSSNAGSKQLYAMMDEVRRARTGREQQGKEINAERYMPA
jgi:hypothetical protein